MNINCKRKCEGYVKDISFLFFLFLFADDNIICYTFNKLIYIL